MKKVTNTILKIKRWGGVLLLSVCSLTACDDVLEVEATGTVSGDIFDTKENIEKALVGAYYNLGGISDGGVGGELFGGDFKLMPTLLVRQNNSEISWDDVNGGEYSNFMDKQVLATNPRLEANWRRAYEVINTLNSILENIDNVSDAAAKSKIQGEALAMRGILYFELVRYWGPHFNEINKTEPSIPLLTSPIVDVNQVKTPALATVEAVYTQAENDLEAASVLLETSGKNGDRLSYFACLAYLMRLNMHQGDYVTAEGYANTIIASNAYALTDTPMEAFNNVSNSTEDIFAVQQTIANNAGDKSTGTGLPNYFSSLSENGLGVMRIFEFSLSNPGTRHGPKYSAVDKRAGVQTNVDNTTTADQITAPFYTNVLNTSLLSSSKFLKPDRVIPVIRLAEIYLSRAESLYEQNIKEIHPTALADLNKVRNRAGLPSLEADQFVTSFAFYDSLVLERKREFLYEGIIFHDLKRWGAKIGLNAASSPKFVMPIPQAEIDTWGN